MLGWDAAACARRARAFGWHAIEVDGYNLNEIDAAYSEAERHTDGPTAIIARTLMGEGFSDVEDRDAWQGKPLRSEMAERAVSELGGVRNMIVVPRAPTVAAPPDLGSGEPLKLPEYEPGKGVATRKAYGEALAAVGAARFDVVVLDGEISNSTFAELFAEAHRTAISKCSSPRNRWLPRLLGCKLAGLSAQRHRRSFAGVMQDHDAPGEARSAHHHPRHLHPVHDPDGAPELRREVRLDQRALRGAAGGRDVRLHHRRQCADRLHPLRAARHALPASAVHAVRRRPAVALPGKAAASCGIGRRANEHPQRLRNSKPSTMPLASV